MHTFGREHEKKCAIGYLRDPAQASLIEKVIDAVHDVLEQRVAIDVVQPSFSRAFVEGGSGVWEQTGSWMRRLAEDNPLLQTVWQDLASHPESKVRFRVACFINEMPMPLAIQFGNVLKSDRSKKVREMAQSRLEEVSS